MKAAFFVIFILIGMPLAAQDLVVMKSGETISCRIDDLTDAIVNVTLPGAAGALGSAKRTLAATQVERVEFGFRPGEEALFAKRGSATIAELKPWWDFWFPHLHRPSSRSGEWGLAYGKALLREEGVIGAEKALSLFDHLIAKAWSPQDKTAAKQGRLEALIAKGDLATATTEARLLARETEDPALLIEVEHLLAQADFQTLRELEEEHPRWVEDDEVRPRRHELYHRALDQFLKPHLFHATREEAAARGLFSAAELLLFGGEGGEAKSRWEDLLKLYPETSFAVQAKERLTALNSPPIDPKANAP
jgi:hypothetical protein